MTRAIDMRELQKLTAGAIQALPHAVPIKNGAVTVGFLLPAPSAASKEKLRKVLDDIDEAAAHYTPEEKAAINAILAERGID